LNQVNRVLCFKPHLHVELAGDTSVFLIGEHEHFMLEGRVYALVAPLIDGRRTERQIIEELAHKASEPEVFYSLFTLERHGYLVEVRPAPAREQASKTLPDGPVNELAKEEASFWYELGADAMRAAERLAATPVAVQALPGEDPEPAIQALQGAGVRIDPEADMRVVLTSSYLDPELDAINQRALARGLSWMPVKPLGSKPWIGPLFRPGRGPCWQCLAHRVRGNRPVARYLEARQGRERPIVPPRARLATTARAALDWAALALAQWIASQPDEPEGHDREPHPIESNLLALSMPRLEIEKHRVVKRPQCPACGDAELLARRARTSLSLEPRPKRFTEDGGYRSIDPEQTFARYEHLISPITGLVASLGPLTKHPLRPVHAAAYFLCPTADVEPDFQSFSRASLGKGRTAAQSRAGALSEALERQSAVFQGDEPRIRARIEELGDKAVHPDALQHFSQAQYQKREQLNVRRGPDWRRRVPLPFDRHAAENIAIDWAPAWSLVDQRERYLPLRYCYLHVPSPPEEQFCHLDPSGHAAGNCLEEAILQGLLELCERDAVGIWWYNRIQRPAVALETFGQPYFEELEANYRDMGYRLWVLDVTTDVGIPAFVALAHAEASNRYCIGFGCHLEARLGVQRALTECNQLFDAVGPSDKPWGDEPLPQNGFLFPDDRIARRRAGDFPNVQRADLRADITACVDQVARLGLDVLVIDQTRPDIGLHAVKVVVPGLRHFWPRLGPGRLYDVPVRMGWLDRPRAESELNPVALYL
jgi:ribosomal protein S12 methylthiotransferase accessory factor